jgi:hypothetical protein
MINKYRAFVRIMVNSGHERTLKPCLMPPGVGHVHTVGSFAFGHTHDLLNFVAITSSLPYDFVTKVTGNDDIQKSYVENMPWVIPSRLATYRVLQLCCITEHFKSIWDDNAAQLLSAACSAVSEVVRTEIAESNATVATWERKSGLRSDLARRWALLELDVLVAMALGLTLDQLVDMYDSAFPVLNNYERNTWFDQSGRIVWTNNAKGLPGVGWLPDGKRRPKGTDWLERYAAMQSGSLACDVSDDTQPIGKRVVRRTFEAPFFTNNRIRDYRAAWSYFESHLKQEAA